jgi:hypothetical protein
VDLVRPGPSSGMATSLLLQPSRRALSSFNVSHPGNVLVRISPRSIKLARREFLSARTVLVGRVTALRSPLTLTPTRSFLARAGMLDHPVALAELLIAPLVYVGIFGSDKRWRRVRELLELLRRSPKKVY